VMGGYWGLTMEEKEPFVRGTICSDAKYLRILTCIRRDGAAFYSMHLQATTLRPILFASLHSVQLNGDSARCLIFFFFFFFFDFVCSHFIFVNCFEITATSPFS
jgi:hypothetical protein